MARAGHKNGVKVLLIEDDEDQAHLIRSWLESPPARDFTVDWASEYPYAVESLRARRHDVALVDYRLGVHSGLDLLAEVPEAPLQVPVILLTDLSDPGVDQQALEQGVVDLIEKNDLNAAVLHRAIRYAVQHFRTLRKLRENRAWFESLYHGIFEAIVVHDGKRVLDANAAFLAMVGRKREAAIGSDLGQYFAPNPAPLLSRATGDDGVYEEVTLKGTIGRTVPTESRVRRFRYEGESAYLVALRDISERKEAEEELRRINAELEARVGLRTAALERSNQDLEKFAEIVAHDIRVPLQTVANYLEGVRAREGADSDPLSTHFVEQAIATLGRVRELVRAVLSYSRISAAATRKQEIDLNSLFADVLAELEEEVQQARAAIRCGELPVVLGDRSLLSTLLRNLIHNALKYCDSIEPAVDVGVSQEGQEWRFWVKDNGTGFDPAEAKSIFDIFYRGGNSTNLPGTGIGLASCKKIVQLHGGRIWATSEPRSGSVFHFTLPVSG